MNKVDLIQTLKTLRVNKDLAKISKDCKVARYIHKIFFNIVSIMH
jgi:hypothetical protein